MALRINSSEASCVLKTQRLPFIIKNLRVDIFQYSERFKTSMMSNFHAEEM